MTVVNVETGEILDARAAERRAERIVLRLEAIADNYAAVMPMIREAIEQRDDLALGYRSPGEYVADRFGGSLQRLGVDVRRAVVGELTAAGLSTRAIAPVVGVSIGTVHNDKQVFNAEHLAPPVANEPFAAVAKLEMALAKHESEQPKKVTGIDGKTYRRPEPKPAAVDRIAEAVNEFPDLAYFRDDERHLLDLADALRDYRAKGELEARLDTLRKSISYDKSIKDGTFVSPFATVTCPTCSGSGTIKEARK